MKRDYKLTTKSGEKISKIKAESILDAIDIFAEMKKITTLELLKIYKVSEA